MTELTRMFGTELTPANIRLTAELGIARVKGTQVRVSSMSTLKVAADLCSMGIPLADQLEILKRSRDNVERVAKDFVRMIADKVLQPYQDQSMPPKEEFPKITDLIWRMRPMAEIVVNAELGRAMEVAANNILADQFEEILKSAEAKRKQ